ncbi:MAG: hypothetical protein U1G08_00005 [Verrucomicrobiota bacterium]
MSGTITGDRRRSLWKAPALLAGFVVAGLLVASRSIDGWRWPPGAFVVVGVLVFGIGVAYEGVTRNRDAGSYRIAVAMTMATFFLLLWSNLVHMVDVNPAAVLYFGVPVVGLIGAAVARLRPLGMARTLWVTAAAQILVVGIILGLRILRDPPEDSWMAPEIRGVAGNVFLALLFAAAAVLFRRAGREEVSPAAGTGAA